MQGRYVLVAFDKITGDIFVAPDMLENPYTKPEAEEFLESFSKTVKAARDFMILPHEQAVGLWTYLQNAITTGKTKDSLN